MSQPRPVLQTTPRNAQAYPWMDRREKHPILKFPQSISFGALTARVAALGRTHTRSIHMPFSELAHTPSNVHPMTTNFSYQVANQRIILRAGGTPQSATQSSMTDRNLVSEQITMLSDAVATATYPQNGHVQPLPTHTLKETRVRESNDNKQMSTPPALPTVKMGKPTPPMLSLPVASPTPQSAIQPPLINDDPILEEAAWQVQTGLFVLLGREEAS